MSIEEKEDKKAMILGIILLPLFIAILVYFNVKNNQDFINNCKNNGGTLIIQDYPQRTYCNLEGE